MADQYDILTRLQQQAAAHTLQSHLLGQRPTNPEGLLILSREVDYEHLRQQVFRLLDPSSADGSTGPPIPEHPPRARQGSLSRNIAELLEVEQARVAKTRLPCALLLVELDDFTAIEESDAAMDSLIGVCRDHLEAVDILSVYERGKIVVILPGINRRQANTRAAAISAAMRSSSSPALPESASMTVSIATALYQAGDAMNAAGLLQRTAEELAGRGDRKNCLLFIDRGTEAQASCQVTVEERTQLFSLLD